MMHNSMVSLWKEWRKYRESISKKLLIKLNTLIVVCILNLELTLNSSWLCLIIMLLKYLIQRILKSKKNTNSLSHPHMRNQNQNRPDLKAREHQFKSLLCRFKKLSKKHLRDRIHWKQNLLNSLQWKIYLHLTPLLSPRLVVLKEALVRPSKKVLIQRQRHRNHPHQEGLKGLKIRITLIVTKLKMASNKGKLEANVNFLRQVLKI